MKKMTIKTIVSRPLADFTADKLLICTSIQKVWQRRHLDFDNIFSHEKVQSEVGAELPACLL